MKTSLSLTNGYIKLFSLLIVVSVLTVYSVNSVAEVKAINSLDKMLKGGAEGKLKLRLVLYAIRTTPVEGREGEIVDNGKMTELLKQHLGFQHELEQSGVMFAAGPVFHEDLTWRGEGLVVVRAESLEDARRIAAADPMHSSGVRTFTVQPWLVAEGGFSMSVTFSDLQYMLK